MLSTQELQKAIRESSPIIFEIAQPFFDAYDYPRTTVEEGVLDRWQVECDPWLELYSELVMLEEARKDCSPVKETLLESNEYQDYDPKINSLLINEIIIQIVDQLLDESFQLSTVYRLHPSTARTMVDRYYLLLWVLAKIKSPYLEADRLFIYSSRPDLLYETKRLSIVHLTAIGDLETASYLLESYDKTKIDQQFNESELLSGHLQKRLGLYYWNIVNKSKFSAEESLKVLNTYLYCYYQPQSSILNHMVAKNIIYDYIGVLLDENLISGSLTLLIEALPDKRIFQRLLSAPSMYYTIQEAVEKLHRQKYNYSPPIHDRVLEIIKRSFDYTDGWLDNDDTIKKIVLSSWFLPCCLTMKEDLITLTTIYHIQPETLVVLQRSNSIYLRALGLERMREHVTYLIMNHHNLPSSFSLLIHQYGVEIERIVDPHKTISELRALLINSHLLSAYREEVGMTILMDSQYSPIVIKAGLFSLSPHLLLQTIQSDDMPQDCKKLLLNAPGVKEALGKQWRQLVNRYSPNVKKTT